MSGVRKHYVLCGHIPPGLAKEDRHAAQHGLKLGIGKQSAAQPADITSVRPNVSTTFDDEDNVVAAAESWILAGDFSGEEWADEDAMLDGIARVLADYLEAPVAPIKATIVCQMLTHAEVLAELRTNAAHWGEDGSGL